MHTLNPALVVLATRADEVRARLRVADEERIACAERHGMYVRECEQLTVELDALEDAIGGLQAAEQAVAMVSALGQEPTVLRFADDRAPMPLCNAVDVDASEAMCLCSLEAGHYGDHITLAGDRVVHQWSDGDAIAPLTTDPAAVGL